MSQAKPSILLVDDIDANLVALEAQLGDLNCELVSVRSGNDALRQLIKREFAVMLLDVQMPGMDGYEVARYARENPMSRDVPIIFVTAMHETETNLFRGYSAGVVDLLFKPINPYVLRSKVNVFLDLHRSRRKLADEIDAHRKTSAELKTVNQELLAASHAKSDFLSMMSHELRTPLNAIIGFSEVLIDQRTGPLNDKQLRYMNHVHDSGGHLLTLINDLLDLSKVEAGRLEVVGRPCSARSLVEEAIVTLQPLASAKKLQLTADVNGTTPLPTIVADPVRVKQVLYNLMSNAIKFTPAEGRVSVHFSTPEAGFLRITVSDTGPGVTPEEITRLFQPFTQLENAKDAPRSGTGLGLSLTRRLVELMGGRASVESTPGEGSRFSIDLPIQPSSTATVARTDEQPATEGPLALVVDDDVASQELLQQTLREAGYRVILASTGEEALTLAHEKQPAVITLDVFLPGIDGWEVLRKLRASSSTVDIPVVLVSVSNERHRAFGLGVLDYLVKPLGQSALLAALDRRGFLAKRSEKHVLVIDDDVRHLELVRSTLEPLGFHVTTAASGKAGIEAAKHAMMDLVLLDLMLPDISGVEVVEALRSDAQTQEVPILLVTSGELSADDRARLHGDVEAVWAKGAFDMTDLAREIGRVVS